MGRPSQGTGYRTRCGSIKQTTTLQGQVGHQQRVFLVPQRDLEARMFGDHKVNQKARTD